MKMHLYRYFVVQGACAKGLKRLCTESMDIDSDVHYFCKDYVRSIWGRHTIMELKVSHGFDEIADGVVGEVKFAVKFLGVGSLNKNNKCPVEAIANSILVSQHKIVERDGFKDIDDFETYCNFSDNIFVETSEEELEEEESEDDEMRKEECGH